MELTTCQLPGQLSRRLQNSRHSCEVRNPEEVNSNRQLWIPATSPTTRLNYSSYSRFKLVMVANRSTIRTVSTLTVHTLSSRSITLSLWSAKR